MSIEKLSKAIDYRVKQLVTAIEYKGFSRTGIDAVAESIDAYRAEVAKEIEGLKGDTRSAEAAYEREKVRADGLAQEQDRWTNEQLPGWRKRVTDAERARDVADAYISRVEAERDDWKADAAASEAKLEKATEERDAYKVQRDGAEIALRKIAKLAEHPDGVVDAEFDPGAPEGDKSVITFECCGVKHTFSPPKLGNWNHQAECQECGSLTTFTSAN